MRCAAQPFNKVTSSNPVGIGRTAADFFIPAPSMR